MIPLIDFDVQYRTIEKDVRQAIDKVLESKQYILGEEVKQFEIEFAEYVGAKHAVAVNSGTSALHLALLAANVGVGDEVITVPATFVATVAAIRYTGAHPVFVDVDEQTLTMDPVKLEEAIGPATKAILPVHLYGHPAKMEQILDVARKRNLIVIEDAAQAHGAHFHGQRVGGLGEFGCFSFYPSKNLGAIGEAGMAVTSNDDAATRMRMLRDWGQSGKYHHDILGFNYRMDGIQGAVLRVKLKHLEKWIERRRGHAVHYSKALKDSGLVLPVELKDNRHVYYVYVVRSPYRDKLQAHLMDREIHTGIHYPHPVHLEVAFQDLGYMVGDFPIAEQAASEVLSLPMYPELEAVQIEAVAEAIKSFEA